MRIAVISMDGKPLSPTTPAKARKLIKSGGAIPKRDKLGTFYIQLTTPTGETIPHDTVVGVDPGKLYAGVGVQTPQATFSMGHVVLPFSVVKKQMGSRRQSRRFRWHRKRPQRPTGFGTAPARRCRRALGPIANSSPRTARTRSDDLSDHARFLRGGEGSRHEIVRPRHGRSAV